MQALDTHSFKRSIGSLAEYPHLLFSFTLYKGLTSLFFFLTPAMPASIPPFVGSATSITMFCLAIAFTCVLFAAFGRNVELLQSSNYLHLMATCLIAGIVLLVLFVPYVSQPQAMLALYFISLELAALGSCAIHIEFGRVMGYLGATYTLVFNVACSLLGLPVTLALLSIDVLPRLILSCVAIVGAVEAFSRSIVTIGRKRIYENPETELSIPWRFLSTSLAQGIAVGFCITLFSKDNAMDAFTGHAIPVCIAAAAAFFFGLAMRVDFDRLIYHIGFAGIGFSCMLFGLATNNRALLTTASLLLLCAYIYLDIILWSLGSHLIKNARQPAIWVAACPSASLMFGRFIGSCLGSNPWQPPASSMLTPTIAAAIISGFGFTALALFLSSGNNLKNGWGFIAPNDEAEYNDRDLAVSLMAEDFRLTQREKDVLQLLAQGKSRSDIAKELIVTPNTIKTHIRNLYSKLGVHSSEELLKMIAHQQHTFESH